MFLKMPEPVAVSVNNTSKLMVCIHIMFGHWFDNSIKMVYWLLGHNLMELKKLKVSIIFNLMKNITSGSEVRIFTCNCMDVGGKIFIWRRCLVLSFSATTLYGHFDPWLF